MHVVFFVCVFFFSLATPNWYTVIQFWFVGNPFLCFSISNFCHTDIMKSILACIYTSLELTLMLLDTCLMHRLCRLYHMWFIYLVICHKIWRHLYGHVLLSLNTTAFLLWKLPDARYHMECRATKEPSECAVLLLDGRVGTSRETLSVACVLLWIKMQTAITFVSQGQFPFFSHALLLLWSHLTKFAVGWKVRAILMVRLSVAQTAVSLCAWVEFSFLGVCTVVGVNTARLIPGPIEATPLIPIIPKLSEGEVRGLHGRSITDSLESMPEMSAWNVCFYRDLQEDFHFDVLKGECLSSPHMNERTCMIYCQKKIWESSCGQKWYLMKNDETSRVEWTWTWIWPGKKKQVHSI